MAFLLTAGILRLPYPCAREDCHWFFRSTPGYEYKEEENQNSPDWGWANEVEDFGTIQRATGRLSVCLIRRNG